MTDPNLITFAAVMFVNTLVLGFILGGHFALRYRDYN